MDHCPICGDETHPAKEPLFMQSRQQYHVRCLPGCENCGGPINDEMNCDRVWNDPGDDQWKARHKVCPG